MARHRDPTLWRTQNFLRNAGLIERLVERCAITPWDIVYDLGAGTGNLTAALAKRAARVIAIEVDATLVARLRVRFATTPNVVVREADIFAHPLPHAEHIVFANPPFDRTADLMRRLTEADVPPRVAYLVLQRQAAERFLGSPGRTLAAALLGPWFVLDVVHHFAQADFAPRPAVDIVLLRVQKRAPPLVPARDAQLYRDLVVTCFVNGRSLLDPRTRPSAIALENWLDLYRRSRTLPRVVRRSIAGAEARLRTEQRSLTKSHRTRAPRDALRGMTLERDPRSCGDELGVVLRAAPTFERERVLEADADALTVRDGPAQHGPRGAFVPVHDERQTGRCERLHDQSGRRERVGAALLDRLDQRAEAVRREAEVDETPCLFDRPDPGLDPDAELDACGGERGGALLVPVSPRRSPASRSTYAPARRGALGRARSTRSS